MAGRRCGRRCKMMCCLRRADVARLQYCDAYCRGSLMCQLPRHQFRSNIRLHHLDAASVWWKNSELTAVIQDESAFRLASGRPALRDLLTQHCKKEPPMRFSLVMTATALCLAAFTRPAPRRDPCSRDRWRVVADCGRSGLGDYTRENQQPVDFGVWQATDGTWQLWSCIRRTGCGQHTRLFYRWEGRKLADTDWRPMGIAMEGKTQLGESSGGLQAPHVIRYQGLYHMAYGDWVNICFATSEDGKTFQRAIQPSGKTGVFTEGQDSIRRDAMLIQIDGLWHCYYTASPTGRGYGYCRTSPDLKSWSHSCVVCTVARWGRDRGKTNVRMLSRSNLDCSTTFVTSTTASGPQLGILFPQSSEFRHR